ncbi:hypothetical protein NC652_034729 [Populus alba x Populus x berolinensis]|nr:hypothetical protein NC652_034729 [Populus alba x Populus x berolinensis]
MAKTRRKTVVTVFCGKDTLHVPVPYKHLHDGSIVLGLQFIKLAVIPCSSLLLPSSLSLTKTSTLCPVVLPTIPKLCPASSLMNTVIVKACSKDKTLEYALSEEEQLDFSFSDDDCCDGSPLPSLLAALVLPLATSREDIPPKFEVWNLCVIGYISGKSLGYRALNGIITSIWKCEASLTIHNLEWLIYRFKHEEDKLVVLQNGSYLVYGKPLILKQMTTYFDFSSEEMMRALI